MIPKVIMDADKCTLWSAPAQFLHDYWDGAHETVNRRSCVRGVASCNHLIQYCVSRGLARSSSFTLSDLAPRLCDNEKDDSPGAQISMELDFSKPEKGERESNRRLLSADQLNYEFGFLQKVVLQNYAGLQALIPKDFDSVCLEYPYKTSFRQYLSSIEQLKREQSFGGFDTSCGVQPLSLPQLLSTRHVCYQWCQHERRPFEVVIQALFEYGLLVGIQQGG